MAKNILFMNTGIEWGGVEKWHYEMALVLQNRGYNVFVLGVKGEMFYNRCKKAGLVVKDIEPIRDVTFINPFRVYWLIKYLKKNEIDSIFFCQSSHFKYGALAARLAGVETIVYRRALAKPIKNKFYNRWLLKYCVTDFMSISKVTRDENLKNISADYLSKDKIKLIYKGVKKDKFIDSKITSNLEEEFGIQNDELIIGNIGRLCRQKAQQYLIEALPQVLKEFEKFKVLLVGKGRKREIFKKKVKELGLENKVIFTGFRDDIPSILRQLDFMVHTAIYEGGCPWIILEAMMAGVPIVATDSTTLPEFITDGENGYLAENKNPNDIAEKMIKMIRTENRDELGRKGAKIAKNKFSFETMIDNIEKKILKK